MKRLLIIALLFAAACLCHSQAQAGGFLGLSIGGGGGVNLQLGGGRAFVPRQQVFVQRQFVAQHQPVFVQRQFAVPVHQQRVVVQQVPVYHQQFAVPVNNFGNCNGAASFSYRSSVFGY